MKITLQHINIILLYEQNLQDKIKIQYVKEVQLFSGPHKLLSQRSLIM